MAVGFINSANVTLSGCSNNRGGNALNYNKLHNASNGLAIWLSVFVGCLLSIQTTAAEVESSETEPMVDVFHSINVKTNLLYDAVTALNFTVEFPLSDRFSLQYEQIFPWWNAGPHGNKYSMQVLSFGGEARWWFAPRIQHADNEEVSEAQRQRPKLLGHCLGLYAHAGKFDIQAGRKFGCYQNYFKGVGLSYGYSLPLGRRANMEFSVSVGYMAIDYQHYIPSSDWSVLLKDNGKAGTKHYFGPTKAKISLVFPIVFKCGGKSK